MRVLLLNAETKLYFAGTNEWTEDAGRAMNFEHIERAVQVYTHENLAYAEIVLEPDPAAEAVRATPALAK